MVNTLVGLAAKVAITDLDNLKKKINYLNKVVIFELVRVCLNNPIKILAFSTLIEYWPYDVFSVKLIGQTLSDNIIILLTSLIKKRKTGNIKEFQLLAPLLEKNSQDKCHFKYYPTSALMNVLLSDNIIRKPVLNRKRKSRSYHEVLEFTKECQMKHQGGDYDIDECITNIDNEKNHALLVVTELFINDTNACKVIQAFRLQKKRQNLFNIIPQRMTFSDISIMHLVQVLKSVDSTTVLALDFSLCDLNLKRLYSVIYILEKFENLEWISLSNNNLREFDLLVLIKSFSQYSNLKYVDISKNFMRIFPVDRFKNVFSELVDYLPLCGLNLSACYIDSKMLINIGYLLKRHFPNIEYLNLNDNFLVTGTTDPASSTDTTNLIAFVSLFKDSKLKHLSIKNCGINNANAKLLCLNALQYISELRTLTIYPNKDLDVVFMKEECLPILKHLPHLNSVPPVY